jgi:hypothetical protein
VLAAALVGAPVAQARPPQRVHGLVIAHDNLPTVASDGRTVFAVPVATTDRGLGLSTVPLEPYSADPERGLPLVATRRDAVRMTEFLARFSSGGRLLVAAPGAEDVPGVNGVLPNTVDGVLDGLTELRCVLAAAHGRQMDDACLDVELPGADARRYDDIVFVHFSGHGVHEGLMLADGVLPAKVFQSEVQALTRAGADLVVVVLDSCYGSGVDGTVVPQTDLPPLTASSGRVALFAASSTVPEIGQLSSGVLTHVVLSGLAGAADEDGDERITFAELSDFFLLHTHRSGQFAARVRAPGANHLRPVLDLTAGRSQVPVSVPRRDAGRFLLADDGGVVTEVHARPALGRRPITLHIPAADEDWSLWFLPVDGAGRPASAQAFRRDWAVGADGARLEEFGYPAGKGPLGDYLLGTQGGDGLFSRGALPPNARKLGRQVTAKIGLGYLGTEAWGRLEDRDVRAQTGGTRDLYAYLQQAEPQWWNLAAADLTVRLHPFTPVHVEGRVQLGATPSARLSADAASVLLTRTLVGAGLSGHLRSRAWVGHAEAGIGLVGLQAERGSAGSGPRDPIPLTDRTPTTTWAGAGLVHRRQSVGVTVDLHGFRDRVVLIGQPEPRAYLSLLGTVGVELLRQGF